MSRINLRSASFTSSLSLPSLRLHGILGDVGHDVDVDCEIDCEIRVSDDTIDEIDPIGSIDELGGVRITSATIVDTDRRVNLTDGIEKKLARKVFEELDSGKGNYVRGQAETAVSQLLERMSDPNW